MSEQPIKPERITKPIQLLGAWLAGLFAIDSCFLIAAANIGTGSWEGRALVIAAIANVPLFLLAVFLLQTRFRPELQEDSYYSRYLSKKTNELITISKDDAQFAELRNKLTELETMVAAPSAASQSAGSRIVGLRFGINKHFPDQAAIGAKLLDRGILAYTSFGGDEPPPDRTVAISGALPPDIIQEVVALARDLDFDGYSLFDPREEDSMEDVLIGSYGGTEFKLAKSQD